MKKDFLSIIDLSAKEILDISQLAKKLKSEIKEKGCNKSFLDKKTLVMIFEKPSLRTRLSFEIGMTQLGGHAIYLGPSDIGLGTRESVKDVAKVASGMGDILMARTFDHKTVLELAKYSSVPVINGLSDLEHPCQALADLFTIWEIKKKLKSLTIAYVGDGENNVPHSLCIGATMLGMNFHCGSPKGYFMDKTIVEKAKKFGQVFETTDPKEAVKNADVVVTDTWTSMGDKNQKERLRIFKSYQVNNSLLQYAKKDAIFMHCLPAYRDKEVSSEVIDGKQSVVFQEAENRLHAQKALMLFLLGKV